ncbi:MAG: hypothetical protein WCJ14_08435 [Verrucomicrobiota bacterium]
MASKFGTLAERLVGAKFWFVPDGSNIGTVLVPAVSSKTVKPASGAPWLDYDMGRITSAKYDPVTQDREREFYVAGVGYKKRKDKWVVTDAFNLTTIDYAETLFDQLMFGLVTAPEDGVSQAAFRNSMRFKDGWALIIRYNEDGSILCQVELHVRLQIAAHPEDKNDPGSPEWRIEHLADAADALEQVTFRPTESTVEV